MNPIKKLAGQTAIYGLPSIIGRLLNYLLVPIHTGAHAFKPEQFGVITEMYAYVSFLVILLTYGMETTLFRFSTQEEYKDKPVFTTAAISLLTSSSVFLVLCFFNAQPLANWLGYPDHSEYVTWFAMIVALDALSAIALAKLRKENKPFRFASANFVNILIFIGLNYFWIGYCMPVVAQGGSNWLTDTFYNPEIGVGYVFIANLIAVFAKFAFLLPEFLKEKLRFDSSLWKVMMLYAYPLLIAGLAGNINEMLDRVMLKPILSRDLGLQGAQHELGIYGACYKLSILMTLAIQAYRYAAEPFFFSNEKLKNSKRMFSEIMTYFVIALSFMFLLVTLYLDVFKHFIRNEDYHVGLHVVPVLLLANMFLGIYFNQSIWYKFSGKTKYGAFIAIGGALLTVTINLIFIPFFSYTASAWATLLCYVGMMVASYILGRKHYPIPYNLRKIGFYIVFALALYFISWLYDGLNNWIEYTLNTLLLVLYIGIALLFDHPKKLLKLTA